MFLLKRICQFRVPPTQKEFRVPLTQQGITTAKFLTTSASNVLFGKRFPPKVDEKKKVAKVAELSAHLKTVGNVDFAELPIIIVKATYNNTLVYLTDHKGVTATWTSAGIEGFKNAKRGTNYAGKVAGEGMAQDHGPVIIQSKDELKSSDPVWHLVATVQRASNLGVNKVRLKVKGLGPGRQEAVKGLLIGGLDIVSVTDTTPIPHNGPRPRKQRRL